MHKIKLATFKKKVMCLILKYVVFDVEQTFGLEIESSSLFWLSEQKTAHKMIPNQVD
jgi:hypothetical protein